MGASGNQGEDYTIDQSCLFDGSSAYLSRTPASASNRILWTQSVWVKRCYLDAFGGAAAIRYQFLLNTNNSPNDGSYFYASDTFEWLHSGSQLRETDQSLRDVAAWYHLVWTFDSNQASEPNRSKLWINGAEVTDYNKEADIDEDETMEINNTILHAIGRNEWDDNNYFNGYMADYILIDGAALTADSFGETNSTTGQWVPIDPSGLTFGTNGFWLDFSDSSALGTDVSRVTTSTAMTSSMWGRDTGDFTFSGDDIASSASDKVIWGPSFSGDFEVTMDVVAQGSFIPGFVILADDMSSNYLTSSGRTAWYWKGDGTDPGIYSNNGGTTVRRQATSDDDLDGVTLKITRTSGTFKWYKDGSLYFTDTSVTHTGPVKFVIQTTGGGNAVDVNNITFVLGYGNNWSTSGLAAADQVTDSPTNNVSTLNPLGMTTSMVLSEGNLVATPSSTNYRWVASTIGIPPTGKWVFEAVRTAGSTGAYIGIGDAVAASGVDVGTGVWYCVNVDTGNIEKRTGGSNTTVQTGSGDLGSSVIRVEYNADDDEIQFFDDGSSMYDAATAGLSPENDNLFFLLGPYATYSNAITATFNEDDFAGTPTSGFKGLSTSNLSSPTIADPTKYFEAVLYTGSGSEKAITSLEFSPDFVWLKNRETTDDHNLIDTVRGATKEINADTEVAETTVAEGLKSFDSNGFTLGTDLEYNTDTETYVSWNWLESVTAGFDIVGWTGDGETSKTLSHNLGVVPDVMMVKNRSAANDWRNFHSQMASDPETDHMVLATALGIADDGYGASSWNDTMPTSSVFYVGDSGSVNTDTENYIAYLWANVEGFSKFGSYIGNGSGDGPFVWCGLRPSFVMTKRTNAAGDWKIWDNKRTTYNVITTSLAANTTAADNTGSAQSIAFLSNGFKIKGTDTETNGDGSLYIFMAFAETPFKTANAR